jgi:hypothetical protein
LVKREDKEDSRDISEEEKHNDIEEIRRVMNFQMPNIDTKFIENAFFAHSLKINDPLSIFIFLTKLFID